MGEKLLLAQRLHDEFRTCTLEGFKTLVARVQLPLTETSDSKFESDSELDESDPCAVSPDFNDHSHQVLPSFADLAKKLPNIQSRNPPTSPPETFLGNKVSLLCAA